MYINIFLFSVLALVMLTGIHHNYLWAQDEPREAEIARETLVDGHWITPHLCGLPFLEKPPLFYDAIAAAYGLTGSVSPTVARSISAVFGILMLAAVFVLSYRWAGARAAWMSVFMLISMPKFYCYSHLVLLDIAVGTFCTIALASFAFWIWWPGNNARQQALLCLFYLSSAGAFLTKGTVGVFHIIAIIFFFCLITRRWRTLRNLVISWQTLLFIAPVGIWIYLFFLEGGVPYLHEHFVNNVIGRFLKVQFVLPYASFYNTDLGKIGPWDFYIYKLPSITGAATLLLPPVLWTAVKRAVPSLLRDRKGSAPQEEIWLLLLSWAVLPVFLLSFSAAKETSYIIPSYAAIAILISAWLDKIIPSGQGHQWQGIGWLSIAAVIAALSLFLSAVPAKTYLFITLVTLSFPIVLLLYLIYRKKIIQACFVAIAVALCGPVIYFSPNVQHAYHFSHSALPLAEEVWSRVGNGTLYLYKPKDVERGSITFYGNRTVMELDTREQLRSAMLSKQLVFVLMRSEVLRSELPFVGRYAVQSFHDLGLNKQYSLLVNTIK